MDYLLPVDQPLKSRKPVYGYGYTYDKLYNKIELKDSQLLSIKDPKSIKIDWSGVIGYESIKEAIDRTLRNTEEKKVHLLIVGAAGTSKTVFLQTVETSLNQQGFNVHYLDATTLSSSGVIEYMFSHDIQYLLLDEIDKLEREHQNTFLNLLEIGILQETKHKRIRKKDMKNTIVLATGNYEDKILGPLKTRFMMFEIPKYTKSQFMTISTKLLMMKYNKTQEIAEYITSRIWDIYKNEKSEEPNMRNCVQVAILTKNDKSDIDKMLLSLKEYSKNVSVEK